MGDIFSKFLYSHYFALTKKKKRSHWEYNEVQEYSFIGGVDFSRDNQTSPASSPPSLQPLTAASNSSLLSQGLSPYMSTHHPNLH